MASPNAERELESPSPALRDSAVPTDRVDAIESDDLAQRSERRVRARRCLRRADSGCPERASPAPATAELGRFERL